MLSLPAHKPTSLLCLVKPVLAMVILSLACLNVTAQLTSSRYRVETNETATFYLGKPGKFNIVLLDSYGKRLDSPRDLETTITVTTLETLGQAKEWLSSNTKSKRTISNIRKITLAKGGRASQIKIIHRHGEEDESIELLSQEPGRVQIFVESENIATGQSAVVVLAPRRPMRRGAQTFGLASASATIIPIAWQDNNHAHLKLDIYPSSEPIITTAQGEQIGTFQVVLLSGDNEHESAPQDLVVILRVDKGQAKFDPNTLTIPKGHAISPKSSELKTLPGGRITVTASTSRIDNIRITPVSREYEFKPGRRSTSLSLRKQRATAYGNGLDGIELIVEALQDGRAIKPEEEGLEERKIFFHFDGDSNGVRFENGTSEITIPKGQHTGKVKLFSVRSVSDLKVVAKSRNGLSEEISSPDEGVPILFSFPWVPMLFALLGGLTFPLLRKRRSLELVQGIVVGGIFFGLALFGAVMSDPQRIGTVSVALTKLPTENALASFILGFLGSILLGSVFILSARYRSSGAAQI